MLIVLLGYYPLHYGVVDFLDLGLEVVTYLETLWPQLLFCLEFLGFTPRHWIVCLFTLCGGYFHYMFYLWSGIHLYTAVTLPNFCEDLIQLKLGFLKRFIIFDCLVSNLKGWEFYIDSLCQVLASCWLDCSFP